MRTATMKRNNLVFTAAVAGLLSTGLAGNIQSAPGNLATSPLFLQTAVQPNIFFMMDDSGSMDWEVLKTAGANAVHTGNSNPNSGNLDFTPNNSAELRELCVGYNALAYDPNRNYTPWQGLDSGGNPYTDQSLGSARTNPYNTGTANISSHFYFVWNDANSDGIYQSGECPLPTNFGSTFSATECAAFSGCQRVDALSAAQQVNYANWYSYYRKREYVMKRAMSSIITRSSARAGMATLHNNQNVYTQVKDIDNITAPISAAATTNKLALLRNLFRIDSSGGTPLRQGLEAVGEYYSGNNPNPQWDTARSTNWWSGVNFGSSPLLPAAQGGECQQNFTILMSDGFWNGPAPNVNDADSDGTPTSPSFDGGLYADNLATTVSNTLADVAMHYYERDLNTSMANKVRIIPNVDDNTAQHMVTYTVAFGVAGTIPAGLQPGDPGFAWTVPVQNNPTTTDDMRHAAYNGRGQFLNAGNPQNLIDALSQQITNIQARSGTAAAVSFNSTSLQAGTRIYQASFESVRWSGNIQAFDISIDPATNIASISGSPWKAATDIDSRPPGSGSPRQFITFDGVNGSGNGIKLPDPIDQAWAALTPAQQSDLRTNSSGSLDTVATGMARLDYLRGARGCEVNNAGPCGVYDDGVNTFSANTLRDRDSALSDIVHSSPFYVGAPSTPYPDNIESTKYSSFAVAKASRKGMLYVGSNGGILHGIDEDGDEIFSYIPNQLFSTQSGAGLHYLSDPNYTHRYYTDLSPVVQDAFVNVGGTTAWRSILVGGLRGGGKGIYAMDVTDPAALNTNAANKIMWEFTHNDLGYTFSDIRIGKMNNGKWAAIFGNGYNSDPMGDGKAKLFIVYLDGTNLSSPVILDTNVGSVTNSDCADPGSDCNGLSTPAIADLNGDGTIDRIYAGDLHGNMWAFDVTGSGSWGVDYSGSPLFTACTPSGCNRQPITSKPSIARHPTENSLSTEPNLMVYFGTGQYLTAGDNTSTLAQTFYGVWDAGSGNLGRNALVGQTITQTTDPVFGNVRTITDNPVDYNSKKGWRIDLPVSKERAITSPLALGNIVFFNTMIPSTNICDAGGSGWLMAVDQIHGGEPSFVPVDTNGDGVFDALDELNGSIVVGSESSGIPTESRFISNKRVTADSTGKIGIDNVQPTQPPQPARMSWTGLER